MIGIDEGQFFKDVSSNSNSSSKGSPILWDGCQLRHHCNHIGSWWYLPTHRIRKHRSTHSSCRESQEAPSHLQKLQAKCEFHLQDSGQWSNQAHWQWRQLHPALPPMLQQRARTPGTTQGTAWEQGYWWRQNDQCQELTFEHVSGVRSVRNLSNQIRLVNLAVCLISFNWLSNAFHIHLCLC